ncbi:MAG: hypothetical protein HYT97_05305 [Elusimicrobia bacterium]|nr:hypothetical protein [Elusimicrobiota bacterium]
MNKRSTLMVFSLLFAVGVFPIKAAEHPHEHPTGAEHPTPQTQSSDVKKEHSDMGKEHPQSEGKSGDATAKESPKEKKEHPKEHPKKGVKEKAFQDQYEKIVKDYVDQASAKTGGVYTIKDEVANKEWNLTLIKVHKSKICMLQANKVCFACADFQEVNGKSKLDLDFYADKAEDGTISINKVLIHKVNGKPRFTYDSQNNMVPLK